MEFGQDKGIGYAQGAAMPVLDFPRTPCPPGLTPLETETFQAVKELEARLDTFKRKLAQDVTLVEELLSTLRRNS